MKHLIKQKLFVAAIAGLALAAAAIFYMKPREVHTAPPLPPPQRSFDDTIAGTGILEASTENISIGTPLGGIVEDVLVQVGQTVAAGEPLFRLETRHLDAEVAVRKAAVSAAQCRLDASREVLADLRDQLERIKRLDAGRVVSTDEKNRAVFAHDVAAAKLKEAEAELQSACAQHQAALTEVERSIVRAPLEATVLQVKVRRGEFAPAGALEKPLIVIGRTDPLHVRVDIDETDAPRISASASATGQIRGSNGKAIPLKFVRFEPFVIPKKSLTGDPAERVDTRVLQCIYEVGASDTPLFIGQQMDVFIEKAGGSAGESKSSGRLSAANVAASLRRD